MTLRPGNSEDARAVLAIQRQSSDAPQWSDAVWRGLLQSPANAEPLRRIVVAVEEERVIAFLVVMLAGDEAEIESVAVAPDARRSGLGTRLCRDAVQWAAERGALAVQLEVRSRNGAARAFYATLGFVEQGRRKGYYRHPDDDAVRLALAL